LFSSSFSLQVVANKKVQHKEPLDPSRDVKWWKGVDVLGKTPKGKGVYQFVKKYGANIDGYSPIYVPDEWSETGDSYAGGVPGLTIWATLLRSLLLGGAFLVYSTIALTS
jgi:photosystem II protein